MRAFFVFTSGNRRDSTTHGMDSSLNTQASQACTAYLLVALPADGALKLLAGGPARARPDGLLQGKELAKFFTRKSQHNQAECAKAPPNIPIALKELTTATVIP
jgi:hypothetical protein